MALTVDVARLRRVLVGNDAPVGTAPSGSKFLLARANSRFSIDLSERVRLDTTTYVERTDRDDPRRHVSVPDTWGFGVELAATYAFDSN